MSVADVQDLPKDTEELTAIVARLVEEVAERERALREKDHAYQRLQEEFLKLQRMLFGRSSEKLSVEDVRQLRLFNEAEAGATERGEAEPSSIVVAEHRRAKPGRKPIADRIPREVVVHDLSAEGKRCPCCRKDRPPVGDEISEEVEIVPARVTAIRHVRKVYGPCRCDGFAGSGEPTIVRAAMPGRMIPGSIAAPGLLAYVVTGKYVDGLPLYRQEKIFSRLGLDIPRSTLCNWVIAAAARCGPLLDVMWKVALKAPFHHMDESPLQVLKEPNRPASSLSYMWVNVAHVEVGALGRKPMLKPLVLYHYHPTRGQEVPLSVLEGFRGHLQTDGYAGYNSIGSLPGVVHVGCFAHVRRKFFDASKITKKAGSAEEALSLIAKLYRVESALRAELDGDALSDEQFVARRKEAVIPILAQFHAWLLERGEQVPPRTALGVAIGYALGEWPKLLRYLDAWYLTPDNNVAENVLRPYVLGRKGWLFADTPRGAHASAALYSLVESARANGLEPYHYLRYLFEHLPETTEEDGLMELLPISVTAEKLFFT